MVFFLLFVAWDASMETCPEDDGTVMVDAIQRHGQSAASTVVIIICVDTLNLLFSSKRSFIWGCTSVRTKHPRVT